MVTEPRTSISVSGCILLNLERLYHNNYSSLSFETSCRCSSVNRMDHEKTLAGNIILSGNFWLDNNCLVNI